MIDVGTYVPDGKGGWGPPRVIGDGQGPKKKETGVRSETIRRPRKKAKKKTHKQPVPRGQLKKATLTNLTGRGTKLSAVLN